MLEHELTPHPDEQRTYAELRSEFRAAHLADLRLEMHPHSHGLMRIGDLLPSSPIDRVRALDSAMSAPVRQDFGLDSAPAKLGSDLESLAQKSLLHESVTWDDSVSGVTDHDAPPCPDVTTMTDDQLCDYVYYSIKESDRE
jgi:hypothetical protein